MKFKRLIKKLILIFLLFTLLVPVNLTFGANIQQQEKIENTEKKEDSIKLYSEAAILMDSKNGTVLYSKNENKKMYPASTTKILTAIIAIEKGNLSDIATTNYSAISVIPAGYASAYLSEGEQISMEYLLQMLLVHSANDAANVIAEHISGSIDNFVNLMNQKAQEIGCKKTHFVNTNGIHNENHYTTATDLALIFKYCLQNETFKRYISMSDCTIPATNKSNIRTYTNTNDLIVPTSSYHYKNCIGGKTGYTSQAKNCLVTACSKNNIDLLCVVLSATQTEKGLSARYVDSQALYNYGYSIYSYSTIAKKSDIIKTIDISNATPETQKLDIILENDILVLAKNSDKQNLTYKVTLNDNLKAPIAENSVIGNITYKIGEKTYSQNLIAAHKVEKNFSSTFIILIIALIFILLILITFIIFKLIKKS